MPINSTPLNTSPVNSGVVALGTGTLVSFEDTVTNTYASTLVSFEQDVELLQSGAGILVSFAEKVLSTASGAFVGICENVKSYIPNTFLNRNGYLPEIYINNTLFSQSYICESININRTVGSAETATLYLLFPASGGINQFFESYVGQSIFINVSKTDGSVHRIFTGWIDNYAVDLIEQKVEFICSNRRQSKVNLLNYSVIESIGQYSQFVFGDAQDQADELSKRLSTAQYDFDFDTHGNYTYTSWTPKTSPDFLLADENVYYDKPQVTFNDRTKTLNTVNITVSYTYQRLHQQVCQVTWNGYADFTRDWHNNGSPSFPHRSAIQDAASATSWLPLNTIRFIPLWPEGSYGGVYWNPNKVYTTYIKKTAVQSVPYQDPITHQLSKTWPDGKQYNAVYDVLDANGNQQYDVDTITIVDTSSYLCRGAQWIAGKKFAQPVTELYSIKLTSPQGISRFGIIDKHENVTINDPYNTSGWEKDRNPYKPNILPATAVGAVVNNAGYAKGSISLTLVAAGTGVFYYGDQITIDGDPSGQIYTVAANTNDISTGITLKLLSPGLAGILAAGTQYTITNVPEALSNTTNFFINEKQRYYWLLQAIPCVIAKAETELRNANRDVIVSFKRSLWPEIDLQHTVQISAYRVSCKAKVFSIEHFIDAASGEAYTAIKLKLSRSFNNDAQSTYNVQVPPFEDISYIGNPMFVVLQSHTGINPDTKVTPSAINWNGYIGNAQVSNTNLQRTNYTEQFIVDYPPIPNKLTFNRTITASLPGNASGVRTDTTGYASGKTSINFTSGGTGQILEGDLITITGDSSGQTYVVQNDVLNVSAGGVLNIQPGLGATLAATNYPINVFRTTNQFTVNIPNDSLAIRFK